MEERMDAKMDQRFDAMEERMDAGMDQRFETMEGRMNQRFKTMGAKMDAMDVRLGGKISALDKRFDDMVGKVDSLDRRMNTVETSLITITTVVMYVKRTVDQLERNQRTLGSKVKDLAVDVVDTSDAVDTAHVDVSLQGNGGSGSSGSSGSGSAGSVDA